jgi:hypothetical protein
VKKLFPCAGRATNDPLPLFFRIADADLHLRRYLLGRQRPGTRMEALSWYWWFLLMIILAVAVNVPLLRLNGLEAVKIMGNTN